MVDTEKLWLNLPVTQFTSIEWIVTDVENGTQGGQMSSFGLDCPVFGLYFKNLVLGPPFEFL